MLLANENKRIPDLFWATKKLSQLIEIRHYFVFHSRMICIFNTTQRKASYHVLLLPEHAHL